MYSITFVSSTCGLLLSPPHNIHHHETTVFLNDAALPKKRTNVHPLLSNVFCKEKLSVCITGEYLRNSFKFRCAAFYLTGNSYTAALWTASEKYHPTSSTLCSCAGAGRKVPVQAAILTVTSVKSQERFSFCQN